jgi:Hydrolase of X-linked nucleoside diphosphate N terminal
LSREQHHVWQDAGVNDPTAEWFRRLRVVAQYGLTYSTDPYDLERFREVAAVADEMAARLESGIVCVPRKLFAVVDRNKHPHGPLLFHVYKLFFLCDLIGGEATTSLETTEVGFFAEHALPPLSRTRVLESQISQAFCHREGPTLPTDFD